MKRVLLVFVFATMSLSAQTLYVVDAANNFFIADPATGATIAAGTVAPTSPKGLAHDGTTLYGLNLGTAGTNVGGLYRINPATGAPTSIGSTGLTGWQDITWDPTGNRFFAVNQNDNLYSISMTGTASLIGPTTQPSSAFHVISGIALDSSGTLWAIDFTTGNLATLSKTTGAFVVAHPTTLTGWQGIAFHPVTGVLYGERPNNAAPTLYTINTQTGVATVVGSHVTNVITGLRFAAPNCPVPQYQMNSAASQLTLSGAIGSPCLAAITIKTPVVPVVAAFASANTGFGWEAVVATSQLVPLNGGGLSVTGGQILNLNTAGPLTFVNGGLAPNFSIPFPGNFNVTFSAPFGPVSLSVQMAVLSPSAPSGFVLSQGCQLTVN